MRPSVFLLLLVLACKPAVVDDTSNTEKTDYSTLILQDSKTTLIGEAQKKSLKVASFSRLTYRARKLRSLYSNHK